MDALSGSESDNSQEDNQVDPEMSEFYKTLNIDGEIKDDSSCNFTIKCKGCHVVFPFRSIQKHIHRSQTNDCEDSYKEADILCLKLKAHQIKLYKDREWKRKNKARVKAMEDERYQVKKKKREEEDSKNRKAHEEKMKEQYEIENKEFRTKQEEEAVQRNNNFRDGILNFMERIVGKFNSNKNFDANDEQFQHLRGIVINLHDKIVKNIEDVVVRANHEVELDDIDKVFNEILNGEENEDSTDIFYMWNRIEGVVVRKLKIIADSLGEHLPCYACNAKSFNVPNHPEVLCDNFSQYKPYSETKCVKGVLHWAKKLSTVKSCLL